MVMTWRYEACKMAAPEMGDAGSRHQKIRPVVCCDSCTVCSLRSESYADVVKERLWPKCSAWQMQ